MKILDIPIARLMEASIFQDRHIGQFKLIVQSLPWLIIMPDRHMAVVTVKGLSRIAMWISDTGCYNYVRR